MRTKATEKTDAGSDAARNVSAIKPVNGNAEAKTTEPKPPFWEFIHSLCRRLDRIFARDPKWVDTVKLADWDAIIERFPCFVLG